MKKRWVVPFTLAALLLSAQGFSQVYYYPGFQRYRVRPQRQYRQPTQSPPFDPVVELSLGYGFPNLDKNYLPQYYNAFNTSNSFTGPFTGSLNYRFSRTSSVGLLVTHDITKAPYYNSSGAQTPVFNASLNNWAFMLNIVNYLPGNRAVTPYTRLAIGLNSWQQNYTDGSGNKIAVQPANLPDLAYQVALGANFRLSDKMGFFAEAGYGKYILQTGLSFKF